MGVAERLAHEFSVAAMPGIPTYSKVRGQGCEEKYGCSSGTKCAIISAELLLVQTSNVAIFWCLYQPQKNVLAHCDLLLIRGISLTVIVELRSLNLTAYDCWLQRHNDQSFLVRVLVNRQGNVVVVVMYLHISSP